MICFNHRENQSIGICKSCGKAVCSDCAIEFSKGLACSIECESDAKELIEMNERGKKLYGIGEYKTNKLASGVWVWLLLSGVMWVTAGVSFFMSPKPNYTSAAMAVVFSIITIIVYRSSKRTGLNV
ncbi:MAG: hypothetical protein ACPGJI_00365 [Kangiellaceae bacterium]